MTVHGLVPHQHPNSCQDSVYQQGPPDARTSWVYRPLCGNREPCFAGYNSVSAGSNLARNLLPEPALVSSPRPVQVPQLSASGSVDGSLTAGQTYCLLTKFDKTNSEPHDEILSSEKSSAVQRAVDSGLGIVSPSADEAQLHMTISKLRTALDTQEAAIGCIKQQLETVQHQYHMCDAERKRLELELCSRTRPPEFATPVDTFMHPVVIDAEREANQLVEIRVERDIMKLQLDALRNQLEVVQEIHAKEQEHLAMEASQCRLLCKARQRQLEQMQCQQHETLLQHANEHKKICARLQTAEEELSAERERAEKLQANILVAEAAMGAAEELIEVSKTAAEEERKKCISLQNELAELNQHSDWQMQRIEELQNSTTGQIMRTYDVQLNNLREAFQMEKRQMHADLAQTKLKKESRQDKSAYIDSQAHHCKDAPVAISDNPEWDELFDESDPALPSACKDAAIQTDEAFVDQFSLSNDSAPQALQKKIQNLENINSELLNSHQEALERVASLNHSMEKLTSTSYQKLLLFSMTKYTTSANEVLANEALQLAEELAILEQKIEQRHVETDALRHTNQELTQSISVLQVDGLQKKFARKVQELKNARLCKQNLEQQLEETSRHLQEQQHAFDLELEQIKVKGEEDLERRVLDAVAEVEKCQKLQVQKPEQLLETRSYMLKAVEPLRGNRDAPQVLVTESWAQVCFQATSAAVQTEGASAFHSLGILPIKISSLRQVTDIKDLQRDISQVAITPSRFTPRRHMSSQGAELLSIKTPGTVKSHGIDEELAVVKTSQFEECPGSPTVSEEMFCTPCGTPAAIPVTFEPTGKDQPAYGATQLEHTMSVSDINDCTKHGAHLETSCSRTHLNAFLDTEVQCVAEDKLVEPPNRQESSSVLVPRLDLQSITHCVRSCSLDSLVQHLSPFAHSATSARPMTAVSTESPSLGPSLQNNLNICSSRKVSSFTEYKHSVLLDLRDLGKELAHGCTSTNSFEPSSMQTLDASLARLARLTGGSNLSD